MQRGGPQNSFEEGVLKTHLKKFVFFYPTRAQLDEVLTGRINVGMGRGPTQIYDVEFPLEDAKVAVPRARITLPELAAAAGPLPRSRGQSRRQSVSRSLSAVRMA
jgi:hypothetical protein